MLNTFSVINNIGPWELIVVFFTCLIGMSFFMLPTLIAVRKNKNNILPVLIVNLVLGWFFLGWIIALIMALKSTPTSVNNQKYSEPTDKHQGPLIYSSENKPNRWSTAIVILIVLLSLAVFMILFDEFSDPYPNNNSPIEFSINWVFPA